jgi:Domain of unknown function (DUF4381)
MITLDTLRDIHQPPAISIWPLAMGWYILLMIIIALIALGCYLMIKYHTKHRIRKLVLIRITELRKKHESSSKQNICEELSALLKRAALQVFPRKKVAGLYGEQWLAFLDATVEIKDKNFSQGIGRVLITGPYQSSKQQLSQELFDLIELWVKQNLSI